MLAKTFQYLILPLCVRLIERFEEALVVRTQTDSYSQSKGPTLL
jgi:hypothetical protein